MSVQTWEAYELTGDFQGKQHSCPFSFVLARSMLDSSRERVLSNYVQELQMVQTPAHIPALDPLASVSLTPLVPRPYLAGGIYKFQV